MYGKIQVLLVGVLFVGLGFAQACSQETRWKRNNEVGKLAYEQGRYGAAERLWLAALKEGEISKPQDPIVTEIINNLALLYYTQGKHTEAEPLYQRSLAIQEKALGPEHPDVATSLENYAKLLSETNRDDEAAEMEARAQAIREKNAQENPHK